MADVGGDQYLPDDMDDNSMGFGNSPGGDIDNQSSGNVQTSSSGNKQNGLIDNELGTEQKLQLAERANEIYRQQLKYMQDHLASLRSLIQDKENIIENLMLRYDLGIITQDANRQGGNLSTDEIEMDELRRKAEALAQRTILENFELREMVNELRDENFHLRNEIYELQDKINRQVLQINKMEKSFQQQNMAANNQDMSTQMDERMQMNEQFIDDDNEEMDGDGDDDDDNIYEMDDDIPSPNINNNNNNNDNDNDNSGRTGDKIEFNENAKESDYEKGRRQSFDMSHPANSEEAIAKRIARSNHERKLSEKPPDLFHEGSDDDDVELTEEQRKLREERRNHKRKESAQMPRDFFEPQSDDSDDNNDGNAQNAKRGTKKRGSIVNNNFMDDEAQRKHNERQQKKHRKQQSSVAAPPLFNENYDPDKYSQKFSAEADQTRKKRRANKIAKAATSYVRKHRRKESLAEKLLLGTFDEDDDIDLAKIRDPEERKKLKAKAKQEQRRKSRQRLQNTYKDHFSDDDVETEPKKSNRIKKRSKKSNKRDNNNNDTSEYDTNNNTQAMGHKKRPSMSGVPAMNSNAEDEKEKKPDHRRDSSAPVVKLGFEDPDVLLHFEQLKVKDLEAELEKKLNEMDDMKTKLEKFENDVESSANANNAEISSKSAEMELQAHAAQSDLEDAVQSKAQLAQKCAMEIMRLTMVLNTLLQIPKFSETVQLLIDESYKAQQRNGRS